MRTLKRRKRREAKRTMMPTSGAITAKESVSTAFCNKRKARNTTTFRPSATNTLSASVVVSRSCAVVNVSRDTRWPWALPS